MAYYLSLRSYQPYAQGHFEWENEGAYKSYGSIASGLSRGFWIDPDLMPKSARQTRDKRLHDVIPMPGMNAVNQRFKDLVEEFEPGIHQFIPLELHDRKGVPIEDQYYVFNCMVSMDALLVRESGLHWQVDEPSGQPIIRINTRKPMVLSKPAIGSHHLWMGLYLHPHTRDDVFCSNAFQKELKARKIRYLDQKPCEELDLPWTPEDNIQPALDWEKVHGEPWGYRPKIRASVLKERGRLEL
jgi:hypothetical protein